MESKIKRENYTVVQGWMIVDLDLKGYELLTYSVIYGFSQAEEHWYSGSLQYLADWIGGAKRTAQNCLQSLLDKGYIEKEVNVINGVRFCKYRVTNFYTVAKFAMGGGEKFATNNKDIDNDISNDISYREGALGQSVGHRQTKVQREDTRFKKPTVDEIAEYCRERNNGIDAQRFFDYYEAKGWLIGKTKMKDWRAAVRTWERGSGTGAGTATRGGKIDYEAEMTEKEREWLKGLDRDED